MAHSFCNCASEPKRPCQSACFQNTTFFFFLHTCLMVYKQNFRLFVFNEGSPSSSLPQTRSVQPSCRQTSTSVSGLSGSLVDKVLYSGLFGPVLGYMTWLLENTTHLGKHKEKIATKSGYKRMPFWMTRDLQKMKGKRIIGKLHSC